MTKTTDNTAELLDLCQKSLNLKEYSASINYANKITHKGLRSNVLYFIDLHVRLLNPSS